MIKIGQKVSFKPMAGIKLSDYMDNSPVEGVVTLINESHRWFMAEYGDVKKVRTCFNFCDIGKKVKLVD